MMKIHVARVWAFFLMFAWCLMSPRLAQAGYLHVWSPQELVKASDVLAVVEFVKPEGAPVPPPNAPHPEYALSPQVRVRVLRSFAVSPQGAIADGEEIIFARDRESIEDANIFARGLPLVGAIDMSGVYLAPGQIVVVPLKAVADEAGNKWRLAAEGGTGSLVPATRRASATTAKNAVKFLGIEVAGALMSEQADERSRAAKYLDYASGGGPNISNVAPMDVISQRLESEVGSDSSRWLDIFISLYLVTGTPRPSVADLLSSDPKRLPRWNKTFWKLAANTLRRANDDDLDNRLAAAFVASAPQNSWAAATALESNYPLHPGTLKFFSEGLAQARPQALERVLLLLDDARKDRDHPLVPVALRAAKSVLKRPKLDPRGLWAACTIIRRFGSEHDVALLINDLKTSQKTDRARYRLLWTSNRWSRERGLIAIHRIVIRDNALESSGQRFCDEAAFSLQETARQNFGWKGAPSLAQRDAIVARARAWLDKNAGAAQTTKAKAITARKTTPAAS